jgi:hypothetical protein
LANVEKGNDFNQSRDGIKRMSVEGPTRFGQLPFGTLLQLSPDTFV